MKKFFFFITFLLVNFSLVAAPFGGKDRPDRGGAPGRREPPKNGRPAPKKSPSSSSKRDREGSYDRKNPSSIKQSVVSEPPQFFLDEEGEDFQPQQTANFRGQRIVLSAEEPKILKTEVDKKNENSFRIALHFNQPVNPASLKAQNIFIGENFLSEDTKMVFNKKVDSVYFEVKDLQSGTIEIKNVEGINGKIVESIKVSL